LPDLAREEGGYDLTDNSQRILDTHKKDPSKVDGDSLIFTIILTNGKGHALDPKNSPVVKRFVHVDDEKKYEFYKKKRDALFVKMTKDMKLDDLEDPFPLATKNEGPINQQINDALFDGGLARSFKEDWDI